MLSRVIRACLSFLFNPFALAISGAPGCGIPGLFDSKLLLQGFIDNIPSKKQLPTSQECVFGRDTVSSFILDHKWIAG
jgi:hypothetical protein